jgi:ribosome modulation factor
MSAYLEGHKAGEAGEPMSANPYRRWTVKNDGYEDWLMGWDDGKAAVGAEELAYRQLENALKGEQV